ncbi:MAG: antitoxin [Mycobacteriales bacterium]
MTRTTIDLDNSVLAALRQRQQRERKSLGQVASELLARALADSDEPMNPTPLAWTSQPMQARVDLHDRDAVQRILDSGG